MIQVISTMLPTGYEYPIAYDVGNGRFVSYISNYYGDQTLFSNGLNVVNIFDGTYILPAMIYYDSSIGKWRIVDRKNNSFTYNSLNDSNIAEQYLQIKFQILSDLMKYSISILKQVPLYHISQFTNTDIVYDNTITPQYDAASMENFVQYCVQSGMCDNNLNLIYNVQVTNEYIDNYISIFYKTPDVSVTQPSQPVIENTYQVQSTAQSDLEPTTQSVVAETQSEISVLSDSSMKEDTVQLQQNNQSYDINTQPTEQSQNTVDNISAVEFNSSVKVEEEVKEEIKEEVKEEVYLQQEPVQEEPVQENAPFVVKADTQEQSYEKQEQSVTSITQTHATNELSETINTSDNVNESLNLTKFVDLNVKLFEEGSEVLLCEKFSSELTSLERCIIDNFAGTADYYITKNNELETWGRDAELDYDNIDIKDFEKAVVNVCNVIKMHNLSFLGGMPSLETLIFSNLRSLFLRPNSVFQKYTQTEYDENVLNLFINMANFISRVQENLGNRIIWVLMHMRITPTQDYKYDGLYFNMFLSRIINVLSMCYRIATDHYKSSINKSVQTTYEYTYQELGKFTKERFNNLVDRSILLDYVYAMCGESVEDGEYPEEDTDKVSLMLDGIKIGRDIFFSYLFYGTGNNFSAKEDILRVNKSKSTTIFGLISDFYDVQKGITPIRFETDDEFGIVHILGMNGLVAYMSEFTFVFYYRQSPISIDALSLICYNYNSLIMSFDMIDDSTIMDIWDNLEIFSKRVVLGLGTDISSNDYIYSSKWLTDLANTDVSHTFINYLSVDTLRALYCFINGVSSEDPDILDELELYDDDELKRIIWKRYEPSGEISTKCLLFFILNRDLGSMLTLLEKEPSDIANIFKNSYHLYDEDMKLSNTVQDAENVRLAYYEFVKNLYYYTPEGEDISLPIEVEYLNSNSASYYTKLTGTLTNITTSYSYASHLNKLDRLEMFKKNVYNTSLYSMKINLRSRNYESYDEITVIDENMRYYFKHILIASATGMKGEHIQEVLGLLCSDNESNNNELSFIPLCGKTVWNTIYKYNIDLGLDSYINEVHSILVNDVSKRRMFFENFSEGNPNFANQIAKLNGNNDMEISIINKLISQIKSGTSSNGKVVPGINSNFDDLVSDGVQAKIQGSNVELVKCVNKVLISRLMKLCISMYPLRGDSDKCVYMNGTNIPTCVNLNFSETGITPSNEHYYKLSGVGVNPLDGINYTNIMNYAKGTMNIMSMNSNFNAGDRFNILIPKWVMNGDTTDKNGTNILSNQSDERECIQYYWKLRFKGMVDNS